MEYTEKQVKDAIRVILSDKKSYTTSLNWAVGYCKSALNMEGHWLKVQVLYILNSISHWRHPRAKEVRTLLKSYSKDL